MRLHDALAVGLHDPGEKPCPCLRCLTLRGARRGDGAMAVAAALLILADSWAGTLEGEDESELH